MMSTSRLASCLRIANISSCLRMVLAFSTSSSSAKVRSSVGDLDFKSWSFISRMRVVLVGPVGGREKGADRKGGREAQVLDEIGRSAFWPYAPAGPRFGPNSIRICLRSGERGKNMISPCFAQGGGANYPLIRTV